MRIDEVEDGGIDAGLLTLEAIYPEGAELSLRDIAAVCGCRMQNIWYIEKQAFKKIKAELERRGIEPKSLIV